LKTFSTNFPTVNDSTFLNIALEIFHYQAEHNPIYKAFINTLGLSVANVTSISKIPFLPISFFKSHDIKTGDWIPESTFTSSGTTGSQTSNHHVADLIFYKNHAQACFEFFFGSIENYHFLALLPHYLERTGSSLVVMMDHFIKRSNSEHSGFYLKDYTALSKKLASLKNDSRKTILWGVSFALLDLAEQHPQDLSECLIFETGGMKGQRREITKNEMREFLKMRINAKTLYSEYGMTELFSQAYSGSENSHFLCPPWMKVVCRDITDPFDKGLLSETGGINVVDLANWKTLSFIETEDLGKVYSDGSFEVLGRLDNSDLRGCNLLIQ
jgi:phenylacetate-coenzyme A ligase PaaK-like adenylate-forming protein